MRRGLKMNRSAAAICPEMAADAPTTGAARSAARHARRPVVLRHVKLGSGCDGIVCTVTVKLVGSATCRIRTTGSHAYAAINRAVERIRTNAASGMVERVST